MFLPPCLATLNRIDASAQFIAWHTVSAIPSLLRTLDTEHMLMYYCIIIQYDCQTNAMAKVFTPFQRQNIPEKVDRQLGLSIMRSDFTPSNALSSKPELSFQFKMNQPLLREALNMLSAKCLDAVDSSELYIPADLHFSLRYAQPTITIFCKR